MKLKYLLISCALLTNCDLFKPSTPECYDKETIGLVKQIINDNLAKVLGIDIQINPKYELYYSKDTGTRTCSASAKFRDGDGIGIETEIKYTITVVKDKDGNYRQLVQIIHN